MKTLLIMRGAHGAGKSTFIKKNHLNNYTVSSDEIRKLVSSVEFDLSGKIKISQDNPGFIWDTIYSILEKRMENGLFTVFDATNTTSKELNKLQTLAKKYRYRCFCMNFKCSLDELKRRNKTRKIQNRVPDDVVEKFYNRILENNIPSGITEITPDELDKVWFNTPIDVSNYKKVNIVGDIHGCFTALKETIGEIIPEEYYVFLGDYCDRGIENVETLKYLMEISVLPNVCMLEGNHEVHLWKWANGEKSNSKEFEEKTKKQLETGGISPKEVRKFIRRLRQCTLLRYNGKDLFCCHGGVSNLPKNKNITLLSSKELIKGTGKYEDCVEVEESFNKHNRDVLQFHGHRNIAQNSIDKIKGNFNLEGGVELGGHLRVVTVVPYGDGLAFEMHYTKNNVFDKENPKIILENSCVENLVHNLRNNRYVQEKKFDNISSFNFTRDAFKKGVWDAQTMRARGLFIDTLNNKIVARSYDKWFKVNERPETQIDNVLKKVKYPVQVYYKENGFLGIFSSYDGKPFFATKSSIDGDYNELFKKIIYGNYGEFTVQKMADFCAKNNCTMVFEVIDPINDPHIIEYFSAEVVLLDIIYNEIEFRKMPYNEMINVANSFDLYYKGVSNPLNNKEDFIDILNFCKNYKNDFEGFVLEDDNGYMVKVKTDFYNFWKAMRGVAHQIKSYGECDIPNIDTKYTKLCNDFISFLKEKKEFNANRIIDLRKEFLEREE